MTPQDDLLQQHILEELKGVRQDIRDLRGDMDYKYSRLDDVYIRKDVYVVDQKDEERRMNNIEITLSVPRILSYAAVVLSILMLVLSLHINHILF